MALDATVAGADADSYLTVAQADALAAGALSTNPEVKAWFDADLDQKEQALRTATSQVNAYVDSAWPLYDRASQGASGLVFPRETDVLAGVPFIPRPVREAVFVTARYLLRNIRAIAAARTRAAQELQSAGEPNLNWSRGTTSLLPDEAIGLLSGFVQAKGGRGLRSVRLGARMPGADA